MPVHRSTQILEFVIALHDVLRSDDRPPVLFERFPESVDWCMDVFALDTTDVVADTCRESKSNFCRSGIRSGGKCSHGVIRIASTATVFVDNWNMRHHGHVDFVNHSITAALSCGSYIASRHGHSQAFSRVKERQQCRASRICSTGRKQGLRWRIDQEWTEQEEYIGSEARCKLSVSKAV